MPKLFSQVREAALAWVSRENVFVVSEDTDVFQKTTPHPNTCSPGKIRAQRINHQQHSGSGWQNGDTP